MWQDNETLADIVRAGRLSESFRAQHPEIPWSPMARRRDQLTPAYDLVNLEEVWRTAPEDIPALLAQLEPPLADAP